MVSSDVSVAAESGVVTLTGFVVTYAEKFAAEKAAQSIYGVKAVANDIEVKTGTSRSDPEIARDIVDFGPAWPGSGFVLRSLMLAVTKVTVAR